MPPRSASSLGLTRTRRPFRAASSASPQSTSTSSSPFTLARADPTRRARSLTRGKKESTSLSRGFMAQPQDPPCSDLLGYYLVRWQGHALADDSWEPVEHLAHCPESRAENEAVAPRCPQVVRRFKFGPGIGPRGPSLRRRRPRWQPRHPPFGPPRPCRPRIGPWRGPAGAPVPGSLSDPLLSERWAHCWAH
jgi:hypothetical protein